MALTFKLNDSVEVLLPAGWRSGKIFKILKGYYMLTGTTGYEVHGKVFVTITSARSLKKIKLND